MININKLKKEIAADNKNKPFKLKFKGLVFIYE